MEIISNLSQKIHFSVESIASFVLFLASGFAAIMLTIFFFHWKKYAMGSAFMVIMELVYIGVCVVLLGAAFFSLN